jgi:AcrR family transcriptional regulator
VAAAGVGMFAAHGYTQVSIEDIGNAVGISGPSVYNHWPNKLDLLVTTLRRGAAACTATQPSTPPSGPSAPASSHLPETSTLPAPADPQ